MPFIDSKISVAVAPEKKEIIKELKISHMKCLIFQTEETIGSEL